MARMTSGNLSLHYLTVSCKALRLWHEDHNFVYLRRAIERLNDVCHQAGWPSWDPLCEIAPPTSEGFFFDYVPQEAAPHLLQALQAAAGPAHSHPSPEYVEGGDDRLVELIAGMFQILASCSVVS